ncbi:uncharacterized protein VP01_629g2 [Puccinia sorghi]|uniref:DDE Tnp4 domain-containing protein n=1 Tax=Puccinia sorghi TaxID=27349 RepID=A0A0L6UH37_9BASI|nr:uncharacterized protein VP01_629g2 [Puccinia sorghi]
MFLSRQHTIIASPFGVVSRSGNIWRIEITSKELLRSPHILSPLIHFDSSKNLEFLKNFFHKNSNVPQRPVQDQLMVTLRQMGISGNGISVGVAWLFRISKGSVIVYCSRVVEAILSLESTYFNWPNHKEQVKIASNIAKSTGFKNCVGFIDGTLLPLDEKPLVLSNWMAGMQPQHSSTFLWILTLYLLSRNHHMAQCLDWKINSTNILQASKCVTSTVLESSKVDSNPSKAFFWSYHQRKQWRGSPNGLVPVWSSITSSSKMNHPRLITICSIQSVQLTMMSNEVEVKILQVIFCKMKFLNIYSNI